MALLRLADFKPGMILTRPLYHDGAVLMEKDTEIRESHIKQLLSWGIETVESLGQVSSIEDVIRQKEEEAQRLPPGELTETTPPVYTINTFPPEYMNVVFEGKIVINGEVPPGVSIQAKNGIEIHGGVTRGEFISSEGDVVFTGGINGEGETYIEAKNFQAKSTEGCTIKAYRVRTENMTDTRVSASESILCETGEGGVVGGSLEAGDKIYLNTAGDTQYTLTEFKVTNETQRKIYETLRLHEKKIEAENSKLLSLEKIIQVVRTLGNKIRALPTDKQQQLKEQTQLYLNIRNSLTALVNNKQKLESALLKRKNGEYLSVVIRKELYPGVQIQIGEPTLTVSSKGKGLGFSLKDNKIITKEIA